MPWCAPRGRCFPHPQYSCKGEIMFKELMPVLKRRPITLTVSSLDGDLVRVNVVPHGLDEDKKGNDSIPYSSKEKVAKIPDEAIKALTTALCLTGTAEEIDAGLVARLTSFTEGHVHLQQVSHPPANQIAAASRTTPLTHNLT